MKLKYEFDGYDYEYEPDDLCDALEYLFRAEYGLTRVQCKAIIDDFNLWDDLEEKFGEAKKEELKEWYEDKAREQFEEDREYDKDTEGFYGTSRRYD